MKIYRSRKNRPFRLSKIEKTKSGYTCVIKWLDTDKFETYPLETIEPYLI
jgi:hypothetical protein